MASVHIPIGDLSSETRELVHRAINGEDIVFDAPSTTVRLTPVRECTVGSLLKSDRFWDAFANLDDDWARDMRQIMKENRENDRDPWA